MCMTDDEVLWAKKQVKFGRDKGIKEKDLRFMENEEIKNHEPNIGPDVKGAIFESRGGNINPKKMLREVGKIAIN
jgi:L-2-hydroxyglutarate oxidase LhgO